MDKKKTDSIFWEKVKTALLIAIVILLLAFVAMLGVVFHALGQYGTQVQNIVTRLDRVTAQLDGLDINGLVETVNSVSQNLQSEQVAGIVASLEEISAQLAEIDMTEIGENINNLLVQAQTSLDNAEEALAKATETLDAIDIDALNSAIADLKAVIEPLARFANRFG